MKINLIILLSILLFSCSKEGEQEVYTASDNKYITRNSLNIGEMLDRELSRSQVVLITYPPYIEESYSLLKFIAMVTSKYGLDGVYIQGLPDNSENLNIQEFLLKKAPYFNFDSFKELYLYLQRNSIKLIPLEEPQGKVIIFTTEEQLQGTKEKILQWIEPDSILSVVLAGTPDTVGLHPLINQLPHGKTVSAIPLKNWRFPELKKEYNYLILNGVLEEYRIVNKLIEYTQENYLEAPTEFIQDQTSIFQGLTLKKMNSALEKSINEHTQYLDMIDSKK